MYGMNNIKNIIHYSVSLDGSGYCITSGYSWNLCRKLNVLTEIFWTKGLIIYSYFYGYIIDDVYNVENCFQEPSTGSRDLTMLFFFGGGGVLQRSMYVEETVYTPHCLTIFKF
jgi:hypothetical protein